MKILTKAFKCSFCGKLYQQEKSCLKHEQKCTRNPEVRPLCFSCANYRASFAEHEKETISFHSAEFGLQEREFSPNTCIAKNCKLFMNYHLHEEVKEALLNADYEEMPTEAQGCEHFKKIGI